MKKRITDILFIMAGAFLFALAVNLFVIPNDLAEGGVTGITIILYYLFEWSPGLMNLLLNGILLIVGYKFLDRTTTVYTIIAVVFNSLFLHLTESWTIASDELWINTIFGGLFAGLGIGLIVRVGGTTAGTVILARLANKYLDWNISYGLLFFDLIVAFSSFFIIGPQGLMCTIVMLFIGTKTMEFIIEGLNPKKQSPLYLRNRMPLLNRSLRRWIGESPSCLVMAIIRRTRKKSYILSLANKKFQCSRRLCERRMKLLS